MDLVLASSPSSDMLEKFAGTNDAFSALKSYAAIQYLARIIEAKGWRLPHAAFKNEENAKAISEKFDVRWDKPFLDAIKPSEFDRLFSLIHPLSLEEFLRKFLPGFVTQRTKTFDILNQLGDIGVENQTLLLLLAKKDWLRWIKGDEEKKGEEEKEEFPTESYELVVKNFVSDEQWQMLLYAVNCYAYSYKSRIFKAPEDAHKVLSAYQCPPEYQIALFGRIRENIMKSWKGRKTKWDEHISDCAHYLRKRIGGDPNIDFLGMDEAINSAVESIGKIKKPTDFLEAVLVNKSNDDSKVENDFVYLKFVDTLLPDDKILVINPSPDFLCQYPSEFLKNTTFCVPYQSMAWVLEHEFNATFITFSEFTINTYCYEPDFNQAVPSFSKILLFSREMSRHVLDRIIEAMGVTITQDGIVYALLPSTDITREVFPAGYFDTTFMIQKLDLLPLDSFHSAPRKKVFVQAINYNKQEPTEKIEVNSYIFVRDKDKNKYLSKQYTKTVELDHDLLYTTKSIYTVYREQLKKPSVRYRSQPCAYAFTKEISFWYIVSETGGKRKKVEAYVCYFPTEQQEKRNLLTRGKKVKGAYAGNTLLNSTEEILDWCENTLPYYLRIQKGVVDAFQEDDSALQSGRATLKTLWYLQLDLNKRKDDPLLVLEKELFSSPVGNRFFMAEEFELLQEAMDEYCDGKTQEKQAELWNILSRVLDYAVKNDYLESNPARSIAQSFREKNHDAVADVRAALVKKTFHIEEEKKLLAFLLEEIPKNSEYLGVLIRFLTGLEPNIVCVLTWYDIHKTLTGIYQFWIYQQVKNNGEGPVPLQYSEDFRRIPIVDLLLQLLWARRDDIEQRLGIPREKMEELQIIASDRQIQEESGKVTPRRLNELSKKALKAIGIQEVVVDLPNDENGTKETNLTKYHGDIFRTNFQYRAKSQCGCTDSETRYILGKRQNTPFGKNYCDYLNEFSQLAIYKKLCRWSCALRPATATTSGIKSISIPQTLTIQSNGDRVSAELEIPLNEHTEDITVQFHCAHGLCVDAYILRSDDLMLEEEGWNSADDKT